MSAYPLPFPLSPGQGVIWVLPTITDSQTEAPIGDWGSAGSVASDLSSGEITAQHLSTFASFFALRWYGFGSVSLPLNATVSGIYPVIEAMEWDTTGNFNAAYKAAAGGTLISGGGGIAAATAFNGPPPNIDQPVDFGSYYVASLGTSLSVLATASIAVQFYTTIPTSGDATLRISLPRIGIYYNAPLMPIGHGANCNAYDPIVLEAGSTSAPGNGILIS